MTKRLCPICGTMLAAIESPVSPFCSERCRNIDLGRWLGERYRIAADSVDDEDSEPGDSIVEPSVDVRHS